jgi:hypothetical protein
MYRSKLLIEEGNFSELRSRRVPMRNKSVRINLSVPGMVDALLADLSDRSGESKAALVMEALRHYLPRLHLLRDRLANPRSTREDLEKSEQLEPLFPGLRTEPDAALPLSRQQTRKLERDAEKLQRSCLRASSAARTGPR